MWIVGHLGKQSNITELSRLERSAFQQKASRDLMLPLSKAQLHSNLCLTHAIFNRHSIIQAYTYAWGGEFIMYWKIESDWLPRRTQMMLAILSACLCVLYRSDSSLNHVSLSQFDTWPFVLYSRSQRSIVDCARSANNSEVVEVRSMVAGTGHHVSFFE